MRPLGFDAPVGTGLLTIILSARRRVILSRFDIAQGPERSRTGKVRQHRAETFAAILCGKSAYLAGAFRL